MGRAGRNLLLHAADLQGHVARVGVESGADAEIDGQAHVVAVVVAALVEAGQQTPVVLIDGRAGSGKSTLAAAVQNLLFKQGESMPRVVHMDDLYPGWDGLAAGSDYLLRFVLTPVSRREVASWQVFDWVAGERTDWREFRGGTPLIVEGCGALSRQAAELADLSVWIEASEEVRHERWLERDGHAFDEQWSPWAAQELDF